MAERIVKRTGDVEKRSKAQLALTEVGFLRKNYKENKKISDGLSDVWEMERKKTEQCKVVLDKMREQLILAQEDIDADYLPEGAQPPSRIAKRDKLQLQVTQLEAALEAQKRVTSRAFVACNEAERKLFESDRNLHQYVDSLEDAELAVATQAELDHDRAERLARLEAQRAMRWEGEQKQALDARAAQIRELTQLATTQLTTAKASHIEAVDRVKTHTVKVKQVVEKIQAIKDEHLADRTQAVLQLKTDQNAVRSEVATQAAKHNKKLADDKRQLESEKATMLAKGLNPYVEFRRRAFAAEGKAREKRMKNAVEDNKASLAERLIKEEGERRKEEAAELKAREYEKKHRDEQGRHVIEERNKNYLTSVMSGGAEVLDPSGRAPRVDPSQVTDVRDHSFGLGIKAHTRIPAESMKRITEKIRRDLQIDKDDLGEYTHLVKGLLSPEAKAAAAAASSSTVRSMSASSATRGDDVVGATVTTAGGKTTMSKEAKEAERAALMMERKAAELRALANKTGTMPGADNAGIELNFAGSEEEKAALLKIATEEAGGESVSAGDLESLEEPKYPAVILSKFENDSFLHAKERQRNRLEQGTEQVAGGRVFRGQSFVPKPAELIFKDFEVGKKYKKIFTLTNASYTFNSFKILNLEDAYIDFFVITFERPGRMSAGVSCSIEIVFTPQLRQDIFTNIRFLTETGPIEVPLKCLIKRCAPRITTTEIDFGKMVLGQKALLPVKITNSQALGTTFTIARYGADEESVAAAAASAMAAIEESQGGSTIRQLSPRPGTEGGGGGPSNSQKTSPRLSSPRAAFDMEAGAGMGSEVASCEAELDARVKRTMTEVLRRKQRENPFPLSMQASTGEVDGYGNTSLQVVCAPLAIGKVEQTFTITFDGVKDTDGTEDDLGAPVMRHQTFTVRVKGYDLPIFLADETVNMMCTLHGRTYRKRLELRNRAKTAYRVNINIPPPFNKYIEVSPNMCFVQGSASQFINIKFVPKEELITKLAHYCVPYEAFTNTALVSLPIEIQVVNQELPVYFILRTEITPSTLNLSSQQLDFGKVYVNQQSTLTLSVTNTSMLPQKIAFVRLKKEMSVKPNDGFAALLPNECMSFEISFCPLSAVKYDLDLILMSSFNDTYTLKVSAEGVETPFEFSTSVIRMRTTGPGERVVASTMIQNKSLKQQCLEIIAPDARFTWLRVAPTIVDLAPLAFARVEFEFLPPREALSLDPKEWHRGLVESVSAELGLSVASEGGGGGGGEEQGSASTSSSSISPLDTWTEEAGWVFAKGMYGEIQWVKAGAGIPPPVEANVVVEVDENAASSEEKQEALGNEEGPETDNGESAVSPVAASASNTLVDADSPKDLPTNEWGICGKWRIPICIKQRARSAAGLSRAQSRGAPNDAGPPLFMCVETMVMLPQLEVEPKILDFGQLAIGTRMLKTIKVVNLTSETIKLRTDGINACGPFCLIAPPRPLGPGEMRSITVQCLPERPGLTVETLELSNSDASVGGHQLRIPLRAQGLKPSIELKGLSKPPPSWSPRSGILDFGNVIAMDKSTLKFSILNNSSFAVDAGITRTSCKGLSPSQAAQLIERTASGLPVIAYRPERVLIQPGDTAVVEVTFNPDRGRFAPFREEFDVTVGQTDEVLRVGVCGRSWNRQVFVLPANPADEAFSKIFSPGGSGVAPVEDLLNSHPSFEVRKIAQDTKVGLNLALPSAPPLKLEFPDPFAPNVDPSTYIEAGSAAAAAPAKGGKGAPAPAAGAAGTRQQQRKILITCAKVLDGRAGAGNATFEIQLSPEAKNSGLFQLSTEKGAVNAGSETPVEIVCTLPKPKCIGGLTVGSWQTFLCNIVVKGGWIAQGETDEESIPLLLKAFVSL